MKPVSCYRIFINFANKTKFDIIMSLIDKPLSVTEIVKKVNKEQSAVSHNLKLLEKCNIISVEKKGKQRICSLNKETVIPMLKLAEKHTKEYCFKRGK